MHRCRSYWIVGAALLAAVTGPLWSESVRAAAVESAFNPDDGQDDSGSGEPAPKADDAPSLDLNLAYQTVFSGIGDSELADLIEQTSQLKALEDKPTATYTGLVRRAEADRERLRVALRSEGYYDGTVAFSIDDSVNPARVAVVIDPGTRYRLVAYDVDFVGARPPVDDAPSPGLALGVPARAKPVADEQVRLVAALQKQGRPFATVSKRVATIDRNEKTMSVRLTIQAGAPAVFGPVAIEGLETLDPAFVRNKIPWTEGERFDRSQVDRLRTLLLGLGLFRSVKIAHAEAVGSDGRLPVTISLVEAMHRSIGAGAAFSTSEGFLLDAFWEHRNLLGAAEKLRLSAEAGTLSQRAVADFRKPDFRRIDQDLLARTSAIRTNSDAFDETTSASFIGLERKLSERWRISGGGSFDLSQVTDRISTETVQLFGVPLKATRDNRDNVLNPTRGSVLGFELTPYGGRGSETLTFGLGRITASGYLALDDRRWIVLAGRTRVAALFGEETTAIPANKRLYSGGGGSVRGYEFQKVGPLDVDHDPVGGSSLFEIGAELRLRVTREIGIVPFVEGGNVYEDTVPELPGRLQWAAGLGLRYHTDIGPARVDFAVPINGRENIDDRFQIYFSLGQAF